MAELGSRSIFLICLEAGSMIVLNILALLGNILVCIAVYRNTKLRSSTNLYIIALAVSDLLSAIFVMPFSTGTLISGRWPFGETVCKVSGFVTVYAVYVSPVTMGLTALNRYVRICKSDWLYQRLFSQKKSVILLASAWGFVAFYLILMTGLTGLQEFGFSADYALCLNMHLKNVSKIIHYVVVVGLFLVLPLALTIFSYRKVFKRIREHNRGLVQASHGQGLAQTPHEQGQRQELAQALHRRGLRQRLAQASHGQAAIRGLGSHEIQISRSLFVVVFAFMLCWIPLWIVNLLSRFRVVANMPRNIELLCAFFLSLSNTINPFIYAGMNPLFRREFKKILRCRCGGLLRETARTLKENTVSLRAQTETTTDGNLLSKDSESAV